LADDYVSRAQMLRDNTIYGNIYLPSEHIRRKREQQRLSGDFKNCLFEAEQELKIKNKINTGLVKFKKAIGVEGEVENIDQIQTVSFKNKSEIEKDREEVCAWYTAFIKSQTSPFTGGDRPTTIIKSSLRSLFKKLFNIDNEDKIGMIVLNPKNIGEFKQLIAVAKHKYASLPEKEDIINKNKDWQVPEAISVFDNYEKAKIENKLIKKSILKPFYLKKDKNDKLQWSFGIAYKKDDNHFYGFYPDFIIKTKKDILVVEIKDDKDFKNENLLKLNAGKDFQKKYKGKEKLHFFIISPTDYFNFFKNLKEQNLQDFKSKYEENLLRFSQSRKVASAEITEKVKKDQELLDLYEKELSKAIKNLNNKKLENEILKIDLENATATIGGLKASLAYTGQKEQKQTSTIKIPNPFNICILGEVADENLIRKKLQEYFAKYGVKATQWDISFFSNTKLRNSDVLGKLKKGQSKYNIIITGQIYHHSGKGNASANILTELKKEKYIDRIIGCSPKNILTIDNIIEKIDEYFNS